MYILYRRLIPVYFLILRIAAWFRSDAKAWVAGRVNWKQNLIKFKEQNLNQSGRRIWMHVASLGEFEQGRVLLEMIRKKHPEHQLVLSFFSPSGFDKLKNYPLADCVCYFPSDNYKEVKDFIEIINPSLVMFVKYDFWFNCLDILANKKIPFCFVSMILRKNHYLLYRINKSLLYKLKPAQQLFLQNEESYKLLKDQSFSNIQKVGDTRWDRVEQIAHENKTIPNIEYFCNSEKIWIAGSIWLEDLDCLENGIRKSIEAGWKIILVPHKIDAESILQIENRFKGQSLRYSNLHGNIEVPILIMDQIGFLAALYRYAQFAYIGGGFGKGIHNILEALIYKIPLCFGPNYKKFPEAIQCIEHGMAFAINSTDDFNEFIAKVSIQKNENKTHFDAYFVENLGASALIYSYLEENNLI